jgi:hypothetical protein
MAEEPGHALDDVLIAAAVAHPSPSLTPDQSLLAAVNRSHIPSLYNASRAQASEVT